MTTPRDDGRFEVPIERLSGGRGQGRRAGIVGIALVTIVGGAFAIARLEDGSAAPIGPTASRLAARTSPSPGPSRPRPSSSRVETLPPIARVALPGAPATTFVERVGAEGTDLRIVVWTPDDGRTRTVRTIPDVIGRDEPSPAIPIVAPNRRHVLLLGSSTTGDPGLDEASVVDDSGHTLWTGDHVSTLSGGLWSADSRLVVVPGRPRLWHLVGLDRPGHASETTVTLPFDVYVPYPVPNGWLTFSSLEPRTVALGLSADGRWIYGGVISPETGMLIGQFRVSADGERVEPVADFGVGRADGMIPRAGTPGAGVVDPATGRIATSRINADTTGGPRSLEVRGPDAAFQFTVEAGVKFGAQWGGDGSLYALTGDTLLYPESIELRRFPPDGVAGPALLSAGSLTGAALIGVRDGYAVVGLLATRPVGAAELVAVDLADPERVTALPLDPFVQLLAATLDR
jgi:hypothetical protein